MSPMTVWKSPPSALHSLSIAVSIFSCVRATCALSTVSPGAPALRKRGNQRKARRGGWRWWVVGEVGGLWDGLTVALQGSPGCGAPGRGHEQRPGRRSVPARGRRRTCPRGETHVGAGRRLRETAASCSTGSGSRGRAGRYVDARPLGPALHRQGPFLSGNKDYYKDYEHRREST